MSSLDIVFDVTGAVAVLNQTLEYAYPLMTIVGEVSQFQVSKGKWVYFDIKDADSKLKCFGSVWGLRMPLEDGMQVQVVARPRLHNLYGFSLNVEAVKPVGEGSIKKASDLLKEKLIKEGLFDPQRKRHIPYPPEHIALIASGESAAYADFIKIVRARWPLLRIEHYDVQVQGMQAEDDIVTALRTVNEQAETPEAVVLIRGGGSADDLSAFSSELVVRAVAASRAPTVVAIGHEIDVSLAELAADLHASTPSNAAELLVPDIAEITKQHQKNLGFLSKIIYDELQNRKNSLAQIDKALDKELSGVFKVRRQLLQHARQRLESYHPKQILKRGYGIVRVHGSVYKNTMSVKKGDLLEIELDKMNLIATTERIETK